MSYYRYMLLCMFTIFLTACQQAEPEKTNNDEKMVLPAPIALTVGEGFVNPIGHYESSPRFSWQVPAESTQLAQHSYQIQVSTYDTFDPEHILWDSGRVMSSKNAWVSAERLTLDSRQRVFWRVKTWDVESNSSRWSETQAIETGLLTNSDWHARWIGHPDTNERTIVHSPNSIEQPDNQYFRPQYLRKTFKLNKPIKRARLYITAKGVFKPFINGQAVSEDVMTPGWTPYHKRIETLTYDVSNLVHQGSNAIGAALAEGWQGRIFHPTKQDYVTPLRLIAQLEVTFADGTLSRVVTDDSWFSTDQGPIRTAGNYDGERYNANFEIPGWNTAEFNNDGWMRVYSEPYEPDVKLRPKRHAPVRVTKTIPAITLVSVKDGVAIFDMGQNMVGVPEVTLPVKKDQTVKIRFSEALQGETFYVRNLRSAKSTDWYVPKSDGQITYQPTFTFHGYRYVEVSGYDKTSTPALEWVKGKVLHSDFDVYDNFSSNHSKLNTLSSNVSWGLRGNFLDIPTDCPQRDERLGWTGDAQVFVRTSLYKADVYAFWASWLESMREEQGIDGMIPKFVPFRPFLTEGTAAAWGDAATIVPWELYQHTGDITVLADNYSMMKRWVKYTEFNSFDYISNIGTYGDWLQPFTENERASGDTHPDLIATAYYARSVDILAKTAQILGYESDANQYRRLFNNIKQKFRTFFFDDTLNLVSLTTKQIKREKGKRLKSPKTVELNVKTTQTSYLLPLAFGLFSEDEQTTAVEKLLALLEKSDRHLRTGFLGTPMLHQVLQKYGHSELMYDILLQETYPSWFYSINNGATTTWERWNSYSLEEGFNKANMNSLNHYAYGAVAEWFYTGMLGIRSLEPGFKTFQISPQFTTRLNNLQGTVPTINGDIKVAWSIAANQLSMSITVPKNTRAELKLPSLTGLTLTHNGESLPDTDLWLEPGSYHVSGDISMPM
ncbi:MULTISPECIES: alpha-L-rhamnosidase [unclassified Alteromonas]|uniref:alpha-L-rhamnosidase n=1 Tax=unclassified Alteromonas TaxID=2614992 RepID=UPI00050988C8|nr:MULTISPECIES: alpha-L-rhamnosidase [unclassified Alteromonas]